LELSEALKDRLIDPKEDYKDRFGRGLSPSKALEKKFI